ncbi:cell division protein FtsL [Thioflexithrix psekupsensis]|uniref:Cell division protein FtsL n=1 Tax=Thioflexithrix psekupsensis TaxID=1570016 RepID=A0A251XAM2_9GAMM|nr:cell division protein FtsL [Thioflexithrix psekupsensis]OUD15021.1 cell division protein FtsL [Thioflexithrix psekupsensis]
MKFFLHIMTLILAVALLTSALALIWVRHENRQMFIKLQQLQQQREQLQQEETQLRLEYSTWSHSHRIDTLARQQLHMQPPDATQKKWIKP